MDIGTPGLGGPNSSVFGINERGQADGIAESSAQDPNNENFCAFFIFTGLKCLPFLWQQGVMTALPLLGGNNGTVGQINNRGEVAGAAETGIRDPHCPSGVAVNGTGPQVLDYEAVIWGPKPGEIRQLSPLPGDTVSDSVLDQRQRPGRRHVRDLREYHPSSVWPVAHTRWSGRRTGRSMRSRAWEEQSILRFWEWETSLSQSITSVRRLELRR